MGLEHSHWERSHWLFLFCSCSPVSMLCCATFHPLCELTSYSVVGTALGPTLNVDIPVIGPGISQTLFSPGPQHRYTEFRSQDCSNHGSVPVVGATGAAQTLTSPHPHMYVHTKSIAAKARPVSVVGALVVCSDVLQVLSLPSWS